MPEFWGTMARLLHLATPMSRTRQSFVVQGTSTATLQILQLQTNADKAERCSFVQTISELKTKC